MFLVSGKFGNKIRLGYANLSILSGKFSGVLKEYLTAYEDLKNIGQIKLFSKNVNRSQVEKENQEYEISKLMSYGELTLQSIEKLFEILIFGFSVYLIMKNQLSIGSIAAVSTILGIYLSSINDLVDLYIKLIGTKEILNNIVKKSNLNETVYPSINEKIEFKDFSYSFGDNNVIKNLNFTIVKGGKYALVGKSGSGKSTVIKLLLGKLKSNSNKLLVDDRPFKFDCDVNFSNQIGYVSQETNIFTGTVRYNICLDEEFKDEEIWGVLDRVCLVERVNSLDNKLDEKLENMGDMLSGGEKQRLVLARILIRKKPILILDEATSALDETTALKIENNILANKDLTVIMISHHIQDEIKEKLTCCVELKR